MLPIKWGHSKRECESGAMGSDIREGLFYQIFPVFIRYRAFFSFFYGDLHPYVITYLINMAILNILLNLAFSPMAGWKMLGESLFHRVTGLMVLSIMIGCLIGAHTWDYPVYLAIALIIMAYNQWRKWPEEGTIQSKITDFLRFLGPALALVILSFLLYLPFNLNFIREQAGHQRGGIGMVDLRTPLGLFLIAFGIFIFFQAVYIISHIRNLNLTPTGTVSRKPFFLFLIASLVILIVLIASGPVPLFGEAVLMMILLFGLIGYLLFFFPVDRVEPFSLILAMVALGLTIFCEFFFLIDHYQGGGYERMNTIFKFYTNVWILLGTAMVYSVYPGNSGSVPPALPGGIKIPPSGIGRRLSSRRTSIPGCLSGSD